MSTTALYKALVEAGTSEDLAEQAVEGLASLDQVATKSDVALVRSDLAELEARLTWRMFVVAGIVTAVVGLIVKL